MLYYAVIPSFTTLHLHSSLLQIERLVEKYIEDARHVKLPVTGDTIKAFGLKAKGVIQASADTTPALRTHTEGFTAGDKWHRNFVTRHGMKSVTRHGEGGSVNEQAAAEGMQKVRAACRDYELENIFNVDETGLQYKILPKRTYLASLENRKTARGTKDMKAKERVSAYMYVHERNR